MCALIADAVPWWEPGTQTAYHAYTFGYIVGELVRRATGKPLAQVLREEVTAPLGIAGDLFFGLPDAFLGRLARLEEPQSSVDFLASLPDDAPFFKLEPRAGTPTAAFGNRADVLRADIPEGGKMSARAIARMYAALLGEVDGVRLISPARLREVAAVAFSGTDQIFGAPTTWALGYATGHPGADPQAPPTAFGWGGMGGSHAFADPASGIAFALTKNRLTAGFSTVEQLAGMVAKAVVDH